MNRFLPSLVILIGFGFIAWARGTVPSNPKIAVIDIDQTLQNTPAGKRASDAFEKTRKTKQDQLDKQQQDLKRAEQDLEKQKPVLKADAYEAKRQELEKKFVDLQQTYLKLEKDLNSERAKLIQDLIKQANPKIEAIAKAEGVSIILDRQAVAWADPSVDLTAKLNAEMK
jgi:outer membrane protein